MSDTSLAAVERLRREYPGTEAVLQSVRSLADAADAELAARFAEIFLTKASRDFLADRSPIDIAHIAISTFRFMQEAGGQDGYARVIDSDEAGEGWHAPVTVIRTRVTERPFIVDSLREFVHSRGLAIVHYVYPVLHVERDAEGRVVHLGPSREGEPRESVIHCEVTRVGDAEVRAEMEAELRRRLLDVVASTTDFPRMVDRLNRVIEEVGEASMAVPGRMDELTEVQDFLRWLREGAFVFLGYRGYDMVDVAGAPAIQVSPGSGLGILRNEEHSRFRTPLPVSELRPGLRELAEGGPSLIIGKANSEATVHRRARMDFIAVKRLDAEGRVLGEHRFLGLFTSKAFGEQAERIPILRQKLREILADAGVAEGSHDYKEINTIFNSMPKEELFLTSAAEIGRDVQAVLTSYGSDEVRVTLRDDPLRLGVSVMVILPRDRFSGDVRHSIEGAFVEAFGGEILNYHLALGSGDQARLHFYVTSPPDRLAQVEVPGLEALVHGLIRNWEDRLRDALEGSLPSDEARRLARHYAAACSPEYRAATEPEAAVQDVRQLEAMSEAGDAVAVTLSGGEEVPAAADGPVTALKLYLRGERIILSDFMPILENAGLRVMAVSPFEIGDGAHPEAVIYLFAVQGADGRPVPRERAPLLSELILRVRAGDATNDPMNALVLGAGLRWREVEVLRSYAEYAFQMGAVPSRLALRFALGKHPEIGRILFDHFARRFDPDAAPDPAAREALLHHQRELFREAMGSVGLLADDRALRRLATLIDATVRTNYYRTGGADPTARSGGVPYLSYKFAVKALESLGRSRLLYEVWVRSSRMEGVHLRGASVARGGIRWSDRPDDFRTEVGGLVKTQMVKNAVIVPGGSKGGFVPLRHLADSEAMAEEGKDQYRTLIRGLLDVTDNLVEGVGLVPPPDVVRWDGDDPYLVVAADKGTAKFSDVANAISEEYGFWLDDAFASGGSNGYDHKVVGITARGGWECVRRHFREMGKDIQSEPFTVVGVGDMSGDVFGNGMLLSRQIRLVAAFDHRHIFIDPDPDPEASYVERERLFGLGRSSWADYNTALLSEGGAVIPRGAKSVELHPAARAALGIAGDAEIADGESLIRAILQAPVELLWNGGIGTYVRGRSETHADAGDTANDAVRIYAHELRAAVVGEGGNLGFTQRGRIEFALAGGRINTDALDNSGGVDLSDHEVNLKILLRGPVSDGTLSLEARNALLQKLSPAVAELVLDNNRSQSRAVSLDEIRAREGVEDFRQLMTGLERIGLLDRQSDQLPGWEILQERQTRGESLVRPELCVLLAYSKMHLTGALLASSLLDDPGTAPYLRSYFPAKAIEVAGEAHLEGHRLRREIVACQLTNELVDLMGATFVERVARDSGHSPAEVARAWLVSARLAGHGELLERLRKAEVRGLPAPAVARWYLGLARVLERTTRWVLAHADPTLPVSEVVERSLPGLDRLRDRFPDVVAGEDRVLYETLVADLAEVGAGKGLARRLITLRFLDQLLEILRVAEGCGADPVDAAVGYYQMSELVQLSWLRQAVQGVSGGDRWEQRVVQALGEDLTQAHHQLTVAVMAELPAAGSVSAAAEKLVARHGPELERFRALLQELSEAVPGWAGLTVATRALSHLAGELAGAG